MLEKQCPNYTHINRSPNHKDVTKAAEKTKTFTEVSRAHTEKLVQILTILFLKRVNVYI